MAVGQWRCSTKESDLLSCLRFLTAAIAFQRLAFFSFFPRFLNWRTELPQEAAFDCRYVVGKKEVYSCQFEGLWAVLLQHKQIIIIDKNSDTALGVSAGVSRSTALRGVC